MSARARAGAHVLARALALPAIALVLVLVLVLGACASNGAIGPHEHLPTDQDVAATLHLAGPAAAPADSTPAANPLPPVDWWTGYRDADLDRWIALGLRDSATLKLAQARLEQARAALDAVHAGELPAVGLGAQSISQRISGNGIYPPPLAGMIHSVNDVDLGAVLELDLFGRLAARTDAARWSAQAGAADRDLARIRLAGAISHAYFELARAQQARRLAVDIETSRTAVLELVRRRVGAGLDTQVEERLAQVTVPEIRVEIERAGEQIAVARHALAVLAGQEPHAADSLDARLPDANALALPHALPLDLLARRADIAAARRRVMAAMSGVTAARADFYPNVNISALIGLDSLTPQKLFQVNSRTWQAGPAVHLPLFDGGALRAQLRGASADADAAIDAYNSAIVVAAREVADAASSIESIERQRSQQVLATANAQAASELAAIRYRAGLGNNLTVLTAQTSVLAQRRAELELHARGAAMDVSLALALGGGFHETPAPLAGTPVAGVRITIEPAAATP